MNKVVLVLTGALLLLCVLGYVAWLFFQDPATEPAPDVKYGERGSTFIKEFLKYDANKDGKIDYEEFKVGYNDFKLNKSAREVMDVREAFIELDENKDGVLDDLDCDIFDRRRDAQEKDAERRKLEAEGLVVRNYAGFELILNPLQREWLDFEIGAANTDELPYAGVRFSRTWFGRWEEEKRAGSLSRFKLLKASYARVALHDDKVIEGFTRESGDEDSAKKEGLAPNKVYVLTYDARISAFARDKVKSVEYFEGDAHVRFIREVNDASPADVGRQLALARQCLKDGLNADAPIIYRRVLVFQFDNQEALDALGYKLNGRHYVKVK